MDKKSIIFLGISILILVVMLYFVGINDVINALKVADLRLILIAIIMQLGFKIDSYCNYYATVHHCIVYYKVEILEWNCKYGC